MSSHGPWCNNKGREGRCPICNATIFFTSCDCGSKVYFDHRGEPWPKHSCFENHSGSIPYPLPAIKKPLIVIDKNKKPKKHGYQPPKEKKKKLPAISKTFKSWKITGIVKSTRPATMKDIGLHGRAYESVKIYKDRTDKGWYTFVLLDNVAYPIIDKQSNKSRITIGEKLTFHIEEMTNNKGFYFWMVDKSGKS